MWRPGEPSLSVASKGMVTLDIEVTGADRDLHSGRYGGTVANPAAVLADILAGLHGPDGAVTVPGFYDGIAELSASRRAEIAAVAWDDAEYRAQLGVDELFGEAGYSTLERLWTRPTLEIDGLTAGGKYTRHPPAARSPTSPAASSPGQDPDRVLDAVIAHVRAHPAPRRPGRRPRRRGPGSPAYTIDPEHPRDRGRQRGAALRLPPTRRCCWR